MQIYLEHGEVEIDNNLVENAIRPTAVGKKNSLFIGHPEAGERRAVIYTLLISAKAQGVDPQALPEGLSLIFSSRT
jgi:transposase